jgi:hypothetical protein
LARFFVLAVLLSCPLWAGCAGLGLPRDERLDEQGEADIRRHYACTAAKEVFALPQAVPSERLRVAVQKLGERDARLLLEPMARSSMGYRCLCGTEAEQVALSCRD